MAPSVQTWEFVVISSGSDEEFAEQLSAAGKEGWDLVNGCMLKDGKATVWTAFLRRPLAAERTAPSAPAAGAASPKATGDTAKPAASTSDTSKIAPEKKAPSGPTAKPPSKPAAKPPEKKAAPPEKDDTSFDVEEDDDSAFDLQL
jgi:hypothetical protein